MKEILDYQKPSLGAYLLGLLVLALGILAAYGTIAVSGMLLYGGIITIMFLFCGYVLVSGAIADQKQLKQQLLELQDKGLLPQATADFHSARQMREDKLRLGANYVYRKNGGRLLQYSEIKQVYQYIKKRNFVESNRSLKVVLSNSATVELCPLRLRGKSDEEMKEIILQLCLHNPNILVGYTNPTRLVK